MPMPLARAAVVAAYLTAPLPALADLSPLVTPQDLAPLVEEEAAVILDIRSVQAYSQGHVQGAVNVPYHAWRGPEDNPGALIADDKLSLLLSEAGVEPDVPVVVTYQGKGTLDFGSAARVYWTLKSAGVEEIAILNGGLQEWTRAGYALSTDEASNFPSDLEFRFARDWLIDEAGVESVLDGTRPALLVDARPEAFFEGTQKHDLAITAGTFQGAVNLVHATWFAGNRLEVTPEQALTAARASGYAPGIEIVSFCNTGHWAATNWFVLSEIAGIKGVRMYPESLVGWTRNRLRFAQN